jgi:hypothetical protein
MMYQEVERQDSRRSLYTKFVACDIPDLEARKHGFL